MRHRLYRLPSPWPACARASDNRLGAQCLPFSISVYLDYVAGLRRECSPVPCPWLSELFDRQPWSQQRTNLLDESVYATGQQGESVVLFRL